MSIAVTADCEQSHHTLSAEPEPPLFDVTADLSGGGGGVTGRTAIAECRRGDHTTVLERNRSLNVPAALREGWVEFLHRYEWD